MRCKIHIIFTIKIQKFRPYAPFLPLLKTKTLVAASILKVGRYSIISYIIPHFRSDQTKNRKPEPAVSVQYF